MSNRCTFQTVKDSSAGKKRPRSPEEDDDPLRNQHLIQYGQPPCDPQDRKVSADVAGGEGALQSGSYALEALSCTSGSRTSCFGAVLQDAKLYLWYYDACGIVYTRNSLSLVSDFEKVAAIIIAIAGCTPERFGAFPPSVMRPLTPYPDAFPPRDLNRNSFSVTSVEGNDELRVTLQSSLTTSYCLTGRRSFIYNASFVPEAKPDTPEREVVVKFSYQAAGRAPEQEIIKRALDAGVEHLPTVHAWKDLFQLEDSARVIAVRKKLRETKATETEIRAELRDAKSKYGIPLYEDRVFRAIVYPKYGSIRDLFVKHFELIPIMVNQMIDCARTSSYHKSFTSLTAVVLQACTSCATSRIFYIATSASTTSCLRYATVITSSSSSISTWPYTWLRSTTEEAIAPHRRIARARCRSWRGSWSRTRRMRCLTHDEA